MIDSYSLGGGTPNSDSDVLSLMGQSKSKNLYSGDSSADVKSSHLPSICQGGLLDIATEGNSLACCSEDKSICIFDWRECVHDYSAMKRTYFNGHMKAVNAVSLRNQKLYSVSRDLSICIWDVPSGSLSSSIANAHELNIVDIQLNQDASRFVTGSRDYSVKVWDAELGKTIKEYSFPRNVVTCLAYGMDNALIYQGSEDLNVRVYDIRSSSKMPVKQLSEYVYFPISIDVRNDGHHLVTG